MLCILLRLISIYKYAKCRKTIIVVFVLWFTRKKLDEPKCHDSKDYAVVPNFLSNIENYLRQWKGIASSAHLYTSLISQSGSNPCESWDQLFGTNVLIWTRLKDKNRCRSNYGRLWKFYLLCGQKRGGLSNWCQKFYIAGKPCFTKSSKCFNIYLPNLYASLWFGTKDTSVWVLRRQFSL